MAFKDNLGPGAASDGGRPTEALAIEMSRTGLRMLATGALAAGSLPTGAKAKEWVVQAGSLSVTTNGGGAARVNFPKPFPNALVAVVFSDQWPLELLSADVSGFNLFKGGAGGTTWLSWIAVGC